jgi:Flp pilus assembly protein TadD
MLQRAIAMEKAGKVEEAIRYLEKCIATTAKPAALYNRLALALIKERRDFRRAEEMIDKAMELDPDNPVYRENSLKIVAMRASASSRKKKR